MTKERLYLLGDPENDLFSDAMDRAAGTFHSVRHGAQRNADRVAEPMDGEKLVRRALAAAFKSYLEEVGPHELRPQAMQQLQDIIDIAKTVKVGTHEPRDHIRHYNNPMWRAGLTPTENVIAGLRDLAKSADIPWLATASDEMEKLSKPHEPTEEPEPCVSHIAMKEYEQALERIIGLSDLEMRDGDGAREIASNALNRGGE